MSASAKEPPPSKGQSKIAAVRRRRRRVSLSAISAVLVVVAAVVVVAAMNDGVSSRPIPLLKPAIVSMPDLFGLSISDAASQMSSLANISVKTYGSANGLVTGQEIAPGQQVRSGASLDLYTTTMPVNMHPTTVSHQTRHAGVNLDAPMAGAYDATFKVASKMWLQDKNGTRARGFCTMTSRTMRDTVNKIGSLLGSAAPQVQVLIENTAQAEVACDDVDARYAGGRWPGVQG